MDQTKFRVRAEVRKVSVWDDDRVLVILRVRLPDGKDKNISVEVLADLDPKATLLP